MMADRKRDGREASPRAAVLDSQSVKTTESGGHRGYDAGKKVRAASVTSWWIRMSAV
jgi:putative transposase